MTKDAAILFALVAMVSAAAAPASAGENVAQKCLKGMEETEARAKKMVPKDEQRAFESFGLIPIFDAKLLCMTENMDGAVSMVYSMICPKNALCGKMKAIMARGLTAQEKDCISSIIKGDIINPPNTEMKRAMYLSLSPETIFAATVLGNKCTR